MSDQNVPFCHLHFHTCYSLLDAMSKVSDVMDYANEIGQSAVAITDHGVMYGAVEFYQKALKKGIKPIIGCEVYLARNGVDDRTSQSNNMHLVLLAETQEGYYNLARIVSMAHLEGFYYKPRIDKKWLREHGKGIIALSACLGGEVTEAAAGDDYEKCKELALEYNDIMGQDNFFIEVQDHGIPEQRIANEVLFKVAEDTGIPVVATNDSHYVEEEDWNAHDILLCINTGDVQNPKDGRKRSFKFPNSEFFFKTQEQMGALFSDVPQALDNTNLIIDKIEPLKLESDVLLPNFAMPAGFTDQDVYLRHLTYEGAKIRYGDVLDENTIERLDFELSII